MWLSAIESVKSRLPNLKYGHRQYFRNFCLKPYYFKRSQNKPDFRNFWMGVELRDVIMILHCECVAPRWVSHGLKFVFWSSVSIFQKRLMKPRKSGCIAHTLGLVGPYIVRGHRYERKKRRFYGVKTDSLDFEDFRRINLWGSRRVSEISTDPEISRFSKSWLRVFFFF